MFFAVVTTDRGDVVRLLDKDGSSFAAYGYDPWGKPLGGSLEYGRPSGLQTCGTAAVSASLAADIARRQVLRCASLVYDAESGLYFSGADSYHPEAGRTVSGEAAPKAVGLRACPTGSLPVSGGSVYNNHGKLHLAGVEYPAYSGNVIRNYDWYSRPSKLPWQWDEMPPDTDFAFDHPVSIVVRSKDAFQVSQVDQIFRGNFGDKTGIEYRDWWADQATGNFGPTWGRLWVDPNDGNAQWGFTTSTLKRRPGGDKDSFFHARFYGHLHDGVHNRAFYSQDWYYIIGTCHMDVNERPGEFGWGYPGGMPKPSVLKSSSVTHWKLSGNSERVEQDITGRWSGLFGHEYAAYDGVFPEMDAYAGPGFANGDRLFMYVRSSVKNAKGHVVGSKIQGKWWRASGRATVLTVPKGRMPPLPGS